MSHTSTSNAVVPIDRPARYGKQLVSHLGRRYGGHWSAEDGRGTIDLQDGKAEVRAAESTLRLSIVAPSESIGRLQSVVGDHLQRFAGTEIDVQWIAQEEPTPI